MMSELNKIFERISNKQATPSDDFFIFIIIFGTHACILSIYWIIKEFIKEYKLRSKTGS